MPSGIYCIKNLINEKRYIGQAIDLERRLYEHKYHMSKGTDKCTALQRAVNKYGIENFDFYVLCECPAENLNELEIVFIRKHESNNRHYGYNIASGGNSGLVGYKWPEEFGEKISATKKSQKLKMPDNVKEMLRSLNIGKVVSEETRKRMSAANTKEKHPMWGKKHTDDAKVKMKSKKGAEKSYQFGTKTSSATSQYHGVCRMISKGHIYWIAYVKVKGKRNHIGSSKIEEDAARMYDEFIIENGLPNPLNFS